MYTGVATFIDMIVGIGAGDDTTFFIFVAMILAGQGTCNYADMHTHTFLHTEILHLYC